MLVVKEECMTQYLIIFCKIYFCKISKYLFTGAEGYETNTFQTKLKKYECCNEKQNEVNSDNKAENDVMRKTKDKLLPRWKKPKRPKWWEEKL